jgi:hypothetical protein
VFSVVHVATVATQQRSKHVSVTIEELCFLRDACRRVINGTSLELSPVVRRWPARNGVSTEAEESPLLEAVTRKRLLKTQQAGTA